MEVQSISAPALPISSRGVCMAASVAGGPPRFTEGAAVFEVVSDSDDCVFYDDPLSGHVAQGDQAHPRRGEVGGEPVKIGDQSGAKRNADVRRGHPDGDGVGSWPSNLAKDIRMMGKVRRGPGVGDCGQEGIPLGAGF